MHLRVPFLCLYRYMFMYLCVCARVCTRVFVCVYVIVPFDAPRLMHGPLETLSSMLPRGHQQRHYRQTGKLSVVTISRTAYAILLPAACLLGTRALPRARTRNRIFSQRTKCEKKNDFVIWKVLKRTVVSVSWNGRCGQVLNRGE